MSGKDDARRADIERLAKAGHSMGSAADIMKITRNALAGSAKRLGITFNGTKQRTSDPKERAKPRRKGRGGPAWASVRPNTHVIAPPKRPHNTVKAANCMWHKCKEKAEDGGLMCYTHRAQMKARGSILG